MEQKTVTLDREAPETGADLAYRESFDAAARELTGQLAHHDLEMRHLREQYADSVRPTPEEIYARAMSHLGKALAWPTDGCTIIY